MASEIAKAGWANEGIPGNRRFKELNRPPEGSSWAWFTAEMLESVAWMALTGEAMRFVMRVACEHLKHGGVDNGRLPVTYADLREIGLHRNKVQAAILTAVELGFIDKLPRLAVRQNNIRMPNLFALTWLPRCDGSPPNNRWTRIKDQADAAEAIRRVGVQMGLRRKPDRRRKAWESQGSIEPKYR